MVISNAKEVLSEVDLVLMRVEERERGRLLYIG